MLTVVSSQAAAEAEPGTGRKAGAPTSMLALLTVTHTLELLHNCFLTQCYGQTLLGTVQTPSALYSRPCSFKFLPTLLSIWNCMNQERRIACLLLLPWMEFFLHHLFCLFMSTYLPEYAVQIKIQRWRCGSVVKPLI